MDDLRLSLAIHKDVAVITVEGNLDFSTTAALRAAIDRCAESRAPRVEIQFGHIGLMDSSGLGALVYAHKLLHQRGKDLELIGDDAVVTRLLKRTSLDRVFRLHPLHPANHDPQAASA
jgi:anti-sigma B factor antagonist